MIVQEHKKEDGYHYIVPIEDGTLEYFCNKAIRTKKTEKTLDTIFQKIINKPNGTGELEVEGYIIKYKKDIQLWEK